MEMETYKVSIHSGVREMETRILQKREPAGGEVLLKVTSCAIRMPEATRRPGS